MGEWALVGHQVEAPPDQSLTISILQVPRIFTQLKRKRQHPWDRFLLQLTDIATRAKCPVHLFYDLIRCPIKKKGAKKKKPESHDYRDWVEVCGQGAIPWDCTLALNPRHLLSLRHQSCSLEIRPAKPSLRWPLQRTGSVSEGQAFFPSKIRRVAIITSSSVSLWRSSSKGSLIPLGKTCDDRVRMRKPLFSKNATAGQKWRVWCKDSSIRTWQTLLENWGQMMVLIWIRTEIVPAELDLHITFG